jgi:YD repeat-containing protein
MQETKDGGRRIVRTSGNGMITATYDRRLRPVEIRNGSDVVMYAYYPNGALKGITEMRPGRPDVGLQVSEDRREVRTNDLRGTSRRFQYDEHGGLAQVSINDSTNVTFTRDTAGRPVLVDYGKFRERYQYDSTGRVVHYDVESEDSKSAPQRIDIGYDCDGGIAKVAAGGFGAISAARGTGNLITFQAGEKMVRAVLDTRGRLAEVIGSDQQAVQYSYGADGLVDKVAYRSGDQRGEAIFRQARLRELVDLSGGRTRYEYTKNGRLASVIDAYGNKSQYSYDDRGILANVLTPDGAKIAYLYDPVRHTLQILAP